MHACYCSDDNYILNGAPLPPHLQVLFIVGRPEVYRAPGSDCYIVFGDVRSLSSRLRRAITCYT